MSQFYLVLTVSGRGQHAHEIITSLFGANGNLEKTMHACAFEMPVCLRISGTPLPIHVTMAKQKKSFCSECLSFAKAMRAWKNNDAYNVPRIVNVV